MKLKGKKLLLCLSAAFSCLTGNAEAEDLTMQMTEPLQMKRLAVTTEDKGGTLLFSDCPEYVQEDGILYSDTVQGPGRIFYYHLNETDKNKKIAVVLENEGKYTVDFELKREALSEPSDNYLLVGKSAQEQFMASEVSRDIFLFSGRKAVLSNEMTDVIVKPGQLVNGIYEFTTNEPVKVSVIMYPAKEEPLQFLKTAKVLPKDEHRLRGTYQGMNRVLTAEQAYNPDTDGIVYLPLGDDENDKYNYGFDATDGSETQNYGNYGVMYDINIPLMGTKEVDCFFSPMGGVYAGAVNVSAAGSDVKTLGTPENRLYFGDIKNDDYQGKWYPQDNDTRYLYPFHELTRAGRFSAAGNLKIEFSPPGASNLPIYLILMPASQS